MTEVKKNRRAKYTESVLQEAMLKLLDEKELQKITVTDLCREADINRGTFYLHYQHPQELLDSIEEELFIEITTLVEKQMKDFNFRELLKEIFGVIEHNKKMVKILLVDNKQQTILHRIIYKVNKVVVVRKEGNVVMSDQMINYAFSFIAEGIVGVIRRWILEGFKDDKEQVIDVIVSLIDETNMAPIL